MPGRIIRVTLFKVPSPQNLQTMLGFYRTMSQTSVKNNTPYILSLHAGPTKPDQRSQGYTLAAKSEFKSLEDMQYYDNEDAAHQELKKKAAGLHEGIMTVYWEGEVVSVL